MTSWRFLSSTGKHDSIQHESLQCLGAKYREVQWHSSSNCFPARCGVPPKDKVTKPSISSWHIYCKWSIPSGTNWFLNRWRRERDEKTWAQYGSFSSPDTDLIWFNMHELPSILHPKFELVCFDELVDNCSYHSLSYMRLKWKDGITLSKCCGNMKVGCANLRAVKYFSVVKRLGLLIIFPPFAALFHVISHKSHTCTDSGSGRFWSCRLLFAPRYGGSNSVQSHWKWETSILCLFVYNCSTITIWSC